METATLTVSNNRSPRVLEYSPQIAPSTLESEDWSRLLQDAADIVAEELPPVVEIVKGIVAEQAKLVIGSGSKSFKTWVTMDMALSIAHGAPWLGYGTTRKRVLYVNLELKPQTFKRRLQTIAKAKDIKIERQWFLHLPLRGKLTQSTVNSLVSGIINLAQQSYIGVVVIDPVYKMNLEGDENSSRDQTLLFNQLDRITTEAKCTLILNDHFGKGNQSEKDPLDAIRGSSAKGGDVDAAMILRKHEVEGCFRVDMVHRELPPVGPFCIGWKFPTMELRPDLDPAAMKKSKPGRTPKSSLPELLRYIRDSSAENPISVSEWANRAGMTRQTLQTYISKMRCKGWISTVGEGSKARKFITAEGKEAVRRWESTQ
jgi:predicted transcriptional regulator